MQPNDISITAADGYELAATMFVPDGAPRACVVINSATAVRRRFYEAYAQYLASQRLVVLTYDYRGIGDSLHGDIRHVKASMTDWGLKDYAGVLTHVGSVYPELPVVVIGHSAGGWLLGLLGEQPGVTAIVTICTQSGHWRHWRGLARLRMLALWFAMMPAATAVLGYFPSKRLGAGENLPGGIARQWARWGRHADYMIDAAGQPLRAGFFALTIPIKSYSFSDDRMAPRPAVDNIHGLFTRASIEREYLTPADVGAKRIGHFGFFRPEHKDGLWRRSLDWIVNHITDSREPATHESDLNRP